MGCNRRQFLGRAAAACGGLLLARAGGAQTPAATLDPERLRKWLAPLPRPARARAVAPGEYRMTMREAFVALHPELPPTRCWTYEGSFPGPTIEVQSGEAVRVRWRNRLPARHFLPVDEQLAAGLPEVRAVTHVHGARVPAAGDGYPEHWTVPGQEQLFHYPNRQEAAPLFYHDHAIALSRLNVYAGLVGNYWVRDQVEAELRLPEGELEIPLLLCDRWLDREGQLFYPTSGVAGHPWVPEVLGNCMLVNGALWPGMEVAPTLVRLRLCNAANGRFFYLRWSEALPWHVIGSDQGLLSAPVTQPGLLLAPGERIDALVEFRPLAGRPCYLLNDGQPILRCEVGAAATPARAPGRMPKALRPLPRTPETAARRQRRLTLDEFDGYHGLPALMLLNGTRWEAPVSETPQLGETEMWAFVNLTDDTHPIHLHQVRFQVLERRAFDVDQYLEDQTLLYAGPAREPAADERGWKDTIRCPGGEVTRILVHFEPYAGRYVWHCHILEHAANMMMRPYEILPAAAGAGT